MILLKRLIYVLPYLKSSCNSKVYSSIGVSEAMFLTTASLWVFYFVDGARRTLTHNEDNACARVSCSPINYAADAELGQQALSSDQ